MRLLVAVVIFCSVLSVLGSARAEAPSGAFDVGAATNAYLAQVPAADRARSDAYFEGGYWFILWDFLYSSAIFVLLLWGGWSARMRNLAERFTRRRPLQTWIYWLQLLLFVSAVSFPLTVYRDYFREHQYGLLNQRFFAWMGDYLQGLLVAAILGGLALMTVMGVVRRLPRTWWLWGAVVSILFGMFGALIAPVYIAPLFNKYSKLTDEHIRAPILSMARANGISVDDVYQFDASRQSKRVSANVSGLFGTERVSLNDNLIKRCSLEEIEAVMGHEMGHYVLNHVYKGLLFFAVLLVIGFGWLRWGLDRSLGRWGPRMGVRDVGDLAVVPLAALLMGLFFFVMTPITNSYTRAEEYEADLFGLNASGQPDGEAAVDLKLGEYRKLDPSRLEEILFFDHPSGRTRITAAMRWKAEHSPNR